MKIKELLKDLNIVYDKKFYKFIIVGVVYTVIALFVYWYFSDVLGIKALIVSLVWIPLSFVVRFIVEKLWVFKEQR